VPAHDAVRTVQFARIWLSLFLNTTAGIAVLGVAKTLLSDVFGSTDVGVDAAFCALFVSALSLLNGGGRLVWAAASDRLGRRNVFTIFFALGAPLYLSIPVWAHTAESYLSLSLFVASTLVIISMYGGAFAVCPAYISDCFGAKDTGVIYGKLLTAWSAAGLTGPTLLSFLRRRAEVGAIQQLAAQVILVLDVSLDRFF
jgi:MFS family permease